MTAAIRAVALMFVTGLGAVMPAGPVCAEDAAMQELWVEYQGFRNRPEFHAAGFAVGGPFHGWLQRIDALVEDRSYGLALLSRCDVVPGDLVMSAHSAMNGPRASAEDRRHQAYVERRFAACFGAPRRR